jgi:hypothetical protein
MAEMDFDSDEASDDDPPEVEDGGSEASDLVSEGIGQAVDAADESSETDDPLSSAEIEAILRHGPDALAGAGFAMFGDDRGSDRLSFPPNAGACATCDNTRRIESRRGSVFLLCVLSATDPHFDRYPRLPVIQCPGWRSRVEPA